MPPMVAATVGRPHLDYDPSQGQLRFHQDRYKALYRACLTGTGGGKTTCTVAEHLAWSLENPGSVQAYFEPDYGMIARNVEPTLERILGAPWTAHPIVLDWNQGLHRIRLRTQPPGVLWLGSLEQPDRAEGPNLDAVGVDEARLVRDWPRTWGVLRRRLRGSRKENPVGAWIATSAATKPIHDFFEGPGHHADAKVYRWSTLDAARWGTLDQAKAEEIARAHTGHAYQQFIEGLYARPSGLVYSEFDPAKHVRPPPVIEDRQAATVAYGIDWGWTDPSVLLATLWVGNVNHAVAEYYRSYATIDELVAVAKSLEAQWGRGPWWTMTDHPEHHDRFRKEGLDVRVYKGKIEDGVALMNSKFKGGELLVSPTCVNVLRELDEYGFDPKTGKPEKGNDHCIGGDMEVLTPDGHLTMSRVREGTTVLGASGWQRVGRRWRPRASAPRLRLVMSDGSHLVATPDHRVLVLGRGFIRMDAVRYADELCPSPETRNLRPLISKDDGMCGDLETATSGTMDASFTGMFGRLPTARSRPGPISTTSTGMMTILHQTSCWSPRKNTDGFTPQTLLPQRSAPTWTRFGRWPKPGIPVPTDGHGILRTRDGPSPIGNPQRGPAISAAHGSNPPAFGPGSAGRIARRRIFVEDIRVTAIGSALDIAVDPDHAFFAGGVLVHNSLDAWRYAVAGHGWRAPVSPPPRWG